MAALALQLDVDERGMRLLEPAERTVKWIEERPPLGPRRLRCLLLLFASVALLVPFLFSLGWSPPRSPSSSESDHLPTPNCLVIHSEALPAIIKQLPDAGHLESAGLGDVLRRTGWSRLVASNSGCDYAIRPFRSAHGYSPAALLNATFHSSLTAGRVCNGPQYSIDTPCAEAIIEPGCTVSIISDSSYRQPWESLACPSAQQSLNNDWLALHPLPPSSVDPRLAIAVHSRWGDLAAYPNDSRRLTFADIRIVVDALRAGGDEELALTLYAEGLPADQKPDLGIEYTLESGGSVVDITNWLASADVLVAGTSGFTILPTILTHGLVIANARGAKQLGLFYDNVVVLDSEHLLERAREVRNRRLAEANN